MNRKSKLIVSSRPQTEKPTKSFLFWKVSNMDQPKINSLFCFFLFIHFIFFTQRMKWWTNCHIIISSVQARQQNDFWWIQWFDGRKLWRKLSPLFDHYHIWGKKKVRSDLRVVPQESLCCYFNQGFSNFTDSDCRAHLWTRSQNTIFPNT